MKEIQFLSKEATHEILGEDLLFVLAFDANGQIVPYYRHIEDNGNNQPPNPTDFINVAFKDIRDAKELMVMGSWCRNGTGGWRWCSGACP